MYPIYEIINKFLIKIFIGNKQNKKADEICIKYRAKFIRYLE